MLAGVQCDFREAAGRRAHDGEVSNGGTWTPEILNHNQLIVHGVEFLIHQMGNGSS